MSRLEKKCLVASAGFHATLFLLLFVAPLLWVSKQQSISLPELNFVPSRLLDGVMSSGGSPTAQAPPPPAATRPAQPQLTVVAPPPKPETAAPKEEVKPEKPEPQPVQARQQRRADPMPTEKKLPTAKADDTDDSADVKGSKRRVRLDFTRASGKSKPADDARSQAQAAARAAQAAADARSAQISRIVGAIGQGISSGTAIDVPGPGGAAFADYQVFVQSVYQRAWVPPPDLADTSATVEATVVILRNGTVESFRVTKGSGHAALNKSVARLDRISFVARFPDGAPDEKRTFIIDFELRSKRPL